MGGRWLRSLLWLGFVSWCLVAPAAAQELLEPPPGPSSVESGAPLASPRRIPGLFLNASQFPGNVTVITAEQIEASGATTLQELLARAEGVTLLDRQGFGLGSDSTLNLRGIVNSSRTNALVLVDGVRQNRFTGDDVHWQSIPLHQIERVEIIRGGAGTLYGEGALAGVINILTKQDSDRLLETDERVEIGTFGWQQYSVAARGRGGPLRYGTSYDRRLVDGYRESSASRSTTVTAHGGLEIVPEAVQMDVKVLHSEDTTDFPGGLTLTQSEQRNEQANPLLTGIFDDEIDQVSLDLLLGPFAGSTWLINGSLRQRTSDSVQSGLYTLTPSRGLSIRNSQEWTGQSIANVLTTGVELIDDKATTGTRGGSVEESNHEGYGLYLEDTLTFWERCSLVAGFRYDRSTFEEAVTAFDVSSFTFVDFVGTLHFEGKSPKIGLTYVVLPGRLEVFSSYSRPFKAPNVDDFASRTPEFSGNVSLQPQQADAYEVGGRATLGPWKLNATWFDTRIHNEILFIQGVPGNPFIFQNQNHDTCRVGLETAARFELPSRGLTGYATYTFIDAKFDGGAFAGNTIPGTPEHVLNAGVGVSPLPALWVNLDWQFVQDYFRINDVSNALGRADHYGVLNLTLQYAFLRSVAGADRPNAKVFVKFLNLTNEKYVAFQASNGATLAGAGENPMPPLQIIGGVSVQF